MADTNGYYPVSPLANAVTRIREELINFLRQYFARQEPPFLRWEDTTTPSPYGIFIADAYPDVPGGTDRRPAIIVERGDAQDFETGFLDDLLKGSLAEQRVVRSWGSVMPTLLHCVSNVELQAEDLQWTVRVLIGLYLDQLAANAESIEDLDHINMKALRAYDTSKGGRSGEGDWHDAPVACQWRLRTSFVQENMSGAPHRQTRAGISK